MANQVSPNELQPLRPTLNEFLSQHGVSNDICSKLNEEDIGWDELMWLEKDDLDVLCGKEQLNLAFKQKLKFKTAVKTLQSAYRLKEKSFIAITMSEQNYLEKVKIQLQNAQNVQTLFENHFIDIDDHSQKLKAKIDNEFDHIINTLKQRRQSLHKKMQEWKLTKLESINKEIADITQYQNELTQTKKQLKQMLKVDHNSRNREYKMNEITEKLFQQNQKYSDFFQFIENNTKLMDIQFNANKTTVNKLDEYGEIKRDGSNSLSLIPKIKLNQVLKIHELDNGYKIRLKWQISHKQQTKNNFIIKYTENIEHFGDEKKDSQNGNGNENENENGNEWEIMNCKQIKCIGDTKYEMDTETILKFNKTYKHKILLMIDYPITHLIESNIIKLTIKYEGAPKGNIMAIPLKIHCHRKHDSDNDPSNMLITNDHKRYYSAVNNDFKSGENDWIVFMINDNNNLYFPTQFVVKNWEYSNAIHSMIIQIGDGKNKWFTFNSNKIFNIKKGSAYHNKYQKFQISGIGSSLIKNNKFKHIKIKFTKNHGNHYAKNHRFIVYEFQLHGMTLDHDH